MKNNIVLKIEGNNVNRIVRKIIKHNIKIYDLIRISNREIYITVNINDYKTISNVIGNYTISIVKYSGVENYKKIVKKNVLVISFLIFSLIFILFLSNFIFKIKIYHTNSNLKNILLLELKNNGIKVGSLCKSYSEIENIKKKILDKYKDSIEWLEITRVGTAYNIRVEERILPKHEDNKGYSNIVATKQGIIKKIYASNGVIVKRENDYVKKGDIIVSGEILLNDTLKGMTYSNALVYAETWYIVKLDYPLYYREDINTKNKKTVFNVNFLNKNYNLFNFNKFRNYKSKSKTILSNSLIPLKFTIENQNEINTIENIYTRESAINKGIEYATNKINDTLDEEEYIISKKVLKNVQKDSTIYMEIFFKIYENITGLENIVPQEE